MQTISKIANFNQHVLYLDSQSLILKNQCLKDCITYLHMGQSVEQLGKWVLVAETPVAKKEPEKMRDVQLLKEHLTLIKRKPVNMPLNTASQNSGLAEEFDHFKQNRKPSANVDEVGVDITKNNSTILRTHSV